MFHSPTGRPVVRWPRRFPPIAGAPIRIEFLPALTARNGKLLSRQDAGAPVHAATFLRQRRIVLDSELKSNRPELERILAHEIFHFAWLRLGNPRRRSYETLLTAEFRRGVRGELGWSAESRKQALRPGERSTRDRHWREYCCESFCDSAAWILTGRGRHGEFTLPRADRERRRQWLQGHEILQQISI